MIQGLYLGTNLNILFLLISTLLVSNIALAGKFYHQNITANFGLINFNLTENASSLTGEDTGNISQGGTSKSSVFSFDLTYEFQNYSAYSLYVKATGPLISSDNSGYFLGAMGVNKYFNSLSTLLSFSDEGSRLSIKPKFRYYIGAGFGAGFLVYNLEDAKKSDVVFDIDLHGGLCYMFGKKWGIRSELGISKGTGIATSSYVIKGLVGINMFLETKNIFD